MSDPTTPTIVIPTNALSAEEAEQFPHLVTATPESVFIRIQELKAIVAERTLSLPELREMVACHHVLNRTKAGPPKAKKKAEPKEAKPSVLDSIKF